MDNCRIELLYGQKPDGRFYIFVALPKQSAIFPLSLHRRFLPGIGNTLFLTESTGKPGCGRIMNFRVNGFRLTDKKTITD